MTIQSVFDPAFSNYGQVLTGYDLTGLLETLEAVTPVPEGTDYVPEQPELMALPPGKGGGFVAKQHPERLRTIAAGAEELQDVDSPEDLLRLLAWKTRR